MPAKYRVQVMEQADEELLYHTRFLSNMSIGAATGLWKSYLATIKEIGENPYQFQEDLREGVPEGQRAALFAKRYQLIFEIEGDTVYINSVRDCRQDPDR